MVSYDPSRNLDLVYQAALANPKKEPSNPLGDILKVIVGGVTGFFTGGGSIPALLAGEAAPAALGGAALGAVKGLSESQNPDVAGVAQTGIGAYDLGNKLKTQLAQQSATDQMKKMFTGNQNISPQNQAILGAAMENPEFQKTIISQIAQQSFPEKKTPNILELLLLQSNPALMKLYLNQTGGNYNPNEWEVIQ